MEKEIADKIMTDYLQTIYGFALSKTHKLDDAEELASMITLDLYKSLLRYNDISNINGYVYRVAANVYARFTDKNKRGIHLSLDEVIEYRPIIDQQDFVSEIIDSESYQLIQRELMYLGKIQRQIMYKHYYESKKIKEIALDLNLPEGTVKWHLHDAKNTIREGMNKMREKGTLGINPIKFSNMGHSGCPGKLGDTSDFLRTVLNQNIAYAAYHKPVSLNEIAQELNVSPVFIEDELEYLVNYGFIDKIANDKYLTNIIIHESTKESDIKLHELFLKYGRILRDIYVPEIIPFVDDMFDKKGIYMPDNDKNLLMWSVITFALCNKLYFKNDHPVDISRYNVKRPDGGEYTAFANVSADYNSGINQSKYYLCGNMNRWSEKYQIQSWQINTCYDNREGSWRENLTEDYEYLYEVITGKIEKNEVNIEKYKRLYDKGYLLGDKINIIKMDMTHNDLCNYLPNISGGDVTQINNDFGREMYEIKKELYPQHMQDWVKSTCFAPLYSTNMRVVELLVDDGTLNIPDENKRKGLNTILFIKI